MSHADANENRLASIGTFDDLLVFLRDELAWPIDSAQIDDLTFDYDPVEELGLSVDHAAKVLAVKQLRSFSRAQGWDIFYVEFSPGYLPLNVLQRILRSLLTGRGRDGIPADRRIWMCEDLLFVSASGVQMGRRIDFAHFCPRDDNRSHDIRVLGWNRGEPPSKLDWVEQQLRNGLRWPTSEEENTWHHRWHSTFLARPARERGAWVDLNEEARTLLISLYAAADLTVDALPYTADFDWMLDAFNRATGCRLSQREFWRALSSARKTGRLTRKER